MKDIRKSPEYRQWRNEVKRRDGNACRRCGFKKNLHVHHIKPLDKYPSFALELDNGITLCGNCHSLLMGKEETTDLRAFLGTDLQIDMQLKAINGNFSVYLERKLKSEDENVRNEAVATLFSHLAVYPDSLGKMLSLLVFLVDSENWDDESDTKCQAIVWLKKVETLATQTIGRYEHRVAQQPPTCGRDVRMNLTITFEESVLGAEKNVRVRGKNIPLKIPAGIEDGQTLRIRGHGHPNGRGKTGDLLVQIAVQPHPTLKRDGLDLVTDATIPMTTWACGTVRVQNVTGEMNLEIPAGTQPEQQLRIRGKGITDASGRKGDLRIRLVVESRNR